MVSPTPKKVSKLIPTKMTQISTLRHQQLTHQLPMTLKKKTTQDPHKKSNYPEERNMDWSILQMRASILSCKLSMNSRTKVSALLWIPGLAIGLQKFRVAPSTELVDRSGDVFS